jgi:pimeloyl-ACP methyl ester carboxylesterase
MKIYLIPGLGADKRMYLSQMRVLADAELLEHLPPRKGETLSDYAQRFIPLIDTSVPFALVGTSLGGMVSIELSRFVKPEKVVLIASVKSRNELPLFMRVMKYVKLHRLLSGNGFKRFNTLAVRRLDSRGDGPAAGLITQMILDASPEFIEWAIDAVIHWQPLPDLRKDIVHIHGTNDRLFPFSRIRDAIAIENGSHVMNITMSSEVNKALIAALKEMT